MNLTAILAVRNEADYIGRCCEHLAHLGASFVIIDNESTDDTVAIARRFRGRGLIDILSHPYPGFFDLTGLMRCKERLARTLDGDWLLHMDADEIPESPERDVPLVDWLARVDDAGHNAVCFDEFVFLPSADDEWRHGDDYVAGMSRYYFFEPQPQRLVRAWRRTPHIDLTESAGHIARFPGRVIHPRSFVLRHYVALSRRHLVDKYTRQRRYDPGEVAQGWHVERSRLTADNIRWPHDEELSDVRTDGGWDRSRPRRRHLFMPLEASPAGPDQPSDTENPHSAT